MKAPTTLTTARLTLTTPTLATVKRVFERYASDPEVTRYVGWPRHRSIAETVAFVEFSQAEWRRSSVGPYLIWARVDGQLLGGTGLSCEPSCEAMTGYVLAKDAWGKGYATEALQAMVKLSGQLGFARIFALCHPEHRASRRVLEKVEFTIDPTWTRKLAFPNLDQGIHHEVKCYQRSCEKIVSGRLAGSLT